MKRQSQLAKKRFPHLNFIAADPHELKLNEKFDYVLICNSLGEWHDIQRVLERIYPLTDDDTRIVITYYNYLWEWVLRLASHAGTAKTIPASELAAAGGYRQPA